MPIVPNIELAEENNLTEVAGVYKVKAREFLRYLFYCCEQIILCLIGGVATVHLVDCTAMARALIAVIGGAFVAVC
ncbi:hypothetical protein [Candidatus Poriferisodalis sp.]|uniref:hypothetical protein n=1 Tax=Candidatus Poriferisodalis sp. TaxID=3101277 RepID=UPI003B5C9390